MKKTYNLILNLDRREFLHPHKLGSGMTLKEVCTGPPAAVLAFLCHGRWAGDRITLAEMDGELFDEARGEYKAKNEELPYVDISLKARKQFEKFAEYKLPKRWDK